MVIFALLTQYNWLECIKSTSYKKCIVCTLETEKCTRILHSGKNTNRKTSVSSVSSDDILLSSDETNETDILDRLNTQALFVLHKLISLCHAVVKVATAVHIYLCRDRFVKTLQKGGYGLQESRIACGGVTYQFVCR